MKKRTLSMGKTFGTVIVVLCAFCFLRGTARAVSADAAGQVAGDVDHSGDITAADARLALRIAVGLEPDFTADTAEYRIADVDGDGAVKAADARQILRWAVNLDAPGVLEKEPDPAERQTLSEALRSHTVVLRNHRNGGYSDMCGTVISEDGKVLLPEAAFYGAEKLEIFGPDGEPYQIVSVLGYSAGDPYALVRLDGSFPAPRIRETPCETDEPISLLSPGTNILKRGRVCPFSDQAPDRLENDQDLVLTTAYIQSRWIGAPVADGDGALVGVTQTVWNGECAYRPLTSLIGTFDETQAIGLSEFLSILNRVTVTTAVEEAVVFPGAAVVCTVRAESANPVKIRYACDSDKVRIVPFGYDYSDYVDRGYEDGVFTGSTGDLISGFTIVALAPAEEVLVRVWASNRLASDEAYIRLRIADQDGEALVNHAGIPLPDLAVISGIMPESITVTTDGWRFVRMIDESISLIDVPDDRIDSIVTAYAYWMSEMGYTYKGEQEFDHGYDGYDYNFIFEDPEIGASVTLEVKCIFVDEPFEENGVKYAGYYLPTLMKATARGSFEQIPE